MERKELWIQCYRKYYNGKYSQQQNSLQDVSSTTYLVGKSSILKHILQLFLKLKSPNNNKFGKPLTNSKYVQRQ